MPYQMTAHHEYKTMDKAPMDGSVIMGLVGRKHPEAIYWSAGAWHYWHLPVATACYPIYWSRLPGDPPSDYMVSDVATP